MCGLSLTALSIIQGCEGAQIPAVECIYAAGLTKMLLGRSLVSKGILAERQIVKRGIIGAVLGGQACKTVAWSLFPQ